MRVYVSLALSISRGLSVSRSLSLARSLALSLSLSLSLRVRTLVCRWKALWPFSLWGAIWSVYRSGYHVGMSLVLVIFVDKVWYDVVPVSDASGLCPPSECTEYVHARVFVSSSAFSATHAPSCALAHGILSLSLSCARSFTRGGGWGRTSGGARRRF